MTIFHHIMSPANRDGEGECFEVNAGTKAVFNDRKQALEALEIGGVPVDTCRHYQLGLTGYHADNCTKNIGITAEELTRLGKGRVIATSVNSVLEEYLRAHPNLSRRIEGRLVFRAE